MTELWLLIFLTSLLPRALIPNIYLPRGGSLPSGLGYLPSLSPGSCTDCPCPHWLPHGRATVMGERVGSPSRIGLSKYDEPGPYVPLCSMLGRTRPQLQNRPFVSEQRLSPIDH